jgi:ribosomal protein S21
MALEVKRKEKENNNSIVHRFTRSVIQSGIIKEARSRKFRLRPLSKMAKKRIALRKVRAKVEYEKKVKQGEIKNRR